MGKTVDDLTQSQQSEKPFPQMAWMDSASTADWIKDRKAKELSLPEQDVPDLKKFSVELRHRIAQAEEGTELHFDLEVIQLLIAGLAMSPLHIFQGISGTGKTSLAKAFAKAVEGIALTLLSKLAGEIVTIYWGTITLSKSASMSATACKASTVRKPQLTRTGATSSCWTR
ncbi:hypothetical protein P4133_22175 [Pseudomonas aeruginosa]|nr:hypothetical protein [Pseudomonas aeruginosa]